MHLPPQQCFNDHALYWRSVSSGVKITELGLFFYDTHVTHSSPSYECPHALGALCGHENGTVFLKCTAMPLIPVNDVPPPFDRFWHAEARCAKTPTLDPTFHITPCDLQRGTSILWADGRVSVMYEMDLDYRVNIVIILIMAWLVINLGESIALVLEVDGSAPQNHSTVALCLALLGIMIANTPAEMWPTLEETIVYWFTIAYIGAYSLYHVKNPNTINVIVGCLILVSSRLYQTNETPYLASFLFVIAARLVQKRYYRTWETESSFWSLIRYIFMLIDLAYFIILYIFVYAKSFRDSLHAPVYLIGLLFPACCLGKFVADYAEKKHNTTSTQSGGSGAKAV
jgi:hypothetical protein